jgi:replication-associated recombination protein RarA
MKFIHVHLFHKEVEFGNIQGYDDVKDLLRRALDSDENCNLLLCGPPASAKTLFLLGILECRKGVYFDGSNTTNRILDVLQEERSRVICIDELDKMPRQFQDKLLNFMESGHIKVDQMRKQYDFKINGAKVFAACNEIARLSRPLQSRFLRLHLTPYTEEQFLEVSVKVLPKFKIASVIGKAVWDQRGDIRDVISIGKLVRKNDGPEEVEQILTHLHLVVSLG